MTRSIKVCKGIEEGYVQPGIGFVIRDSEGKVRGIPWDGKGTEFSD